MATNLEFIKSASGSSVSSLSVTDCFSATYDVYAISVTKLDMASDGGYIYLRLIDSSSSVISASEYDRAYLLLNAATTFTESRATSTSTFTPMMANVGGNSSYAGGNMTYIYNPYDSSSYTFSLGQSSAVTGGSQMYGQKSIAVHKVAEQITGINITPSTAINFDNITVNVYGVK